MTIVSKSGVTDYTRYVICLAAFLFVFYRWSLFCKRLRNLSLLDRFERMVNIHLLPFFLFSLFTSSLTEITENIRTAPTVLGFMINELNLEPDYTDFRSSWRVSYLYIFILSVVYIPLKPGAFDLNISFRF